jgi:hypothetical protein
MTSTHHRRQSRDSSSSSSSSSRESSSSSSRASSKKRRGRSSACRMTTKKKKTFFERKDTRAAVLAVVALAAIAFAGYTKHTHIRKKSTSERGTQTEYDTQLGDFQGNSQIAIAQIQGVHGLANTNELVYVEDVEEEPTNHTNRRGGKGAEQLGDLPFTVSLGG